VGYRRYTYLDVWTFYNTLYTQCGIFVVRVDNNLEIHPFHVLKTVLLDLSKM